MTLRIGDVAPDFTAKSTAGEFQLHQYIEGSWAVFFSHPADFTPVCTTELGRVQKLLPEFAKRNVKVFAISVDPIDKHDRWVNDINETQGVTVSYPILADPDRLISTQYGMLDQTNMEKATGMPVTVRSVFIIDPSKKIRWIITYPASCGRNFDEILRCVDSLQLTDRAKVATPADWKAGDDAIVLASIDNATAKAKFGEFREVKPYLRFVTSQQYSKA